MSTVKHQLESVKQRIAAAAIEYGRSPDDISLLAVSKGQSPVAIRAAWEAGQPRFGENYVNEALEHIAALPDAEWHFIGTLQSNKSKQVAQHFAWVHTVDRVKIAERLSAHRGALMPPLQVCIQVNIDDEAAKSGCAPNDVLALAKVVATLPNLRLRGLMAIPAAHTDPVSQRRAFAAVRVLFDECRHHGVAMDTLSMGMSGDLEAAIAEGATLVRVGTAVFGPRA